jgi:hypothetical protein
MHGIGGATGTSPWNGYAACILTNKDNGEVITVTSHCFLNAPTEGNCFGKVNVAAGPRQGRRATITWHDTLINDVSVQPGAVVIGSKINGRGAGVWYQ